jgi:hypothetical protein
MLELYIDIYGITMYYTAMPQLDTLGFMVYLEQFIYTINLQHRGTSL